MQSQMQGISVVVPVFNSTHALIELTERIANSLEPMSKWEILLVDDGSSGNTWETVKQLSASNARIKGLRLGRNYGQHSALLAGIRAAEFELTVTIDDDLQNPPEEIPRLVEYLIDSDLDVVYGFPLEMKQTLSRRIAGRTVRKVLSKGLGHNTTSQISSFRVFRTACRDAFSSDLGADISLDALLGWGNSRFGSIQVEHANREFGRSNYSFRKLLRHSIDTITGYSTLPLKVASLLGLFTSVFGLGVLVYVVAVPLISGQSVQGFPFLASTIAIFSGVQLLTLGVIGEYLARMHFRVMKKPTYYISEIARSDSLTNTQRGSHRDIRDNE